MGKPVATGFVWRHTWPSRSCRGGGGRRVLVTPSRGDATTFLTDLTAIPSVRTVLSGVRFDRFWGRSMGGHRDMVAMPTGVVTWLLSRRADPSRLGAHRFKTEGCAPFPSLSLSFLFFLLLPLPSCLVFSGGFRCSWRGSDIYTVQGTCSWCLERGGGGHSDMKAPTGETSQQRQGTCREEEMRR
ncbi:hypothetical protein Taro_028363 [Colocasia esculenta]|uniref:Uncharacterized protein n=1 Tax=Colocasia esculenta TaxID=4460 RepID=A0A843VGB4_COLES|nr:hypothetical protein [Colocasia esculenta]